ncbi:Sigma4-Adaptin [Thecamonas trahens ATCC 50062]|uniref:AP complex subunit sigma n=1 Tax=Thecamonas trahens ATCC 50062 TaxID=461836 RepID=A0A0L0DIR8_THETB|nr:Sigma4-Adaptin [Thecamonas trahens ATCC 50062]KNC52284.1 Sigma4-Adaptin [Thecamonas trahens ATCC 50062]|eukprot:XP_013762283.1 Sigma4-Adaptin [Thecamonas trahens ATCC 50062]
MIHFLLIANMQGQVRLARHYPHSGLSAEQAAVDHADIIRKAVSRSSKQSSFFAYGSGIIVCFRRYASLYFMIGVDDGDNELAALELIQLMVEALNTYFNDVTELDIMLRLELVHIIIDEVIANGHVVDANQANILRPLKLMATHAGPCHPEQWTR